MERERMIRRILVANRGEIARRVFRTCRRLGIGTAAVYSDADADEPFVREAGVAVHLGGSEPAASYLDITKVTAAARTAGADAVHPGYGFLSENADFAAACREAGLVFIGPPPQAIRDLGSKEEAKRIATGAGVPTLAAASLADGADPGRAAAEVGYPLLVKAAAGGGGKGMRIVREAADLAAATEAAGREAEAAFGDGSLLLERFLDRARHIEVQVLADRRGNVGSLFERECSVQRRYQKVIEEAPSPAVDDDLRERLGEAAVSLARAVSYEGAGTVEFLVEEDGSFWFLEMNARLQVEHPVTELVTGLDLAELQIRAAEGADLSGVLEGARRRGVRGWAVQARLYAEDPAAGYLPGTGTLHCLEFGEEVRVDAGPESGSRISVFYDPLLAKVIAGADDRAGAIRKLAAGLRSARIHGPVTNRDLLVGILEHDDFRAGRADTGWLERRDAARLAAPLAEGEEWEAMLAAASLAGQAERRAQAPVLGSVPSGYRNNPSQLNSDRYRCGEREVKVGYRITEGRVTVELDDQPRPEARLLEAAPDRVRLRWRGLDRVYRVARAGERVFVDTATGSVALTLLPRLPTAPAAAETGSLNAPMPGKILRVEIAEGDRVEAGDPLVVMEAMKMEHTVSAPHPGVVASVDISPGDQVESGQLLAVLNP